MKGRLCFWLAAVVLAMAAIPLEASDRSCDEFLVWYDAYTGPPYPGDLIPAYAAHLKKCGKGDDDVRAALEALRKNPPPGMMQRHFDKVFTLHTHLFTHEPNALMARTIRGLKPGKALDAGMGQGRNAVYLASQGWTVTGYDFSPVALKIARENAAKAGVTIEAIESTHEQFDFGKEQWDLIVLTYSFVSMSDAALVKRIKDSVKPGGLIVVEQPNSGGEVKGPANALFRSFDDLRVVFYEDKVDTADWSMKPMRIGRVVVQKD